MEDLLFKEELSQDLFIVISSLKKKYFISCCRGCHHARCPLLPRHVGDGEISLIKEAYGSAVDLSFLKALHLPQFIIDKMYIHGQYYQPTFLYESLRMCDWF